jgi:hypothetical protein
VRKIVRNNLLVFFVKKMILILSFLNFFYVNCWYVIINSAKKIKGFSATTKGLVVCPLPVIDSADLTDG